MGDRAAHARIAEDRVVAVQADVCIHRRARVHDLQPRLLLDGAEQERRHRVLREVARAADEGEQARVVVADHLDEQGVEPRRASRSVTTYSTGDGLSIDSARSRRGSSWSLSAEKSGS